ncbi:NAD(P)-binding domain-containing protein [Candidatus Dojkabacteria bacterium]|uniref:NAD(P)-binding domain-containing protein n=1 Tax=Candidatus Dojkabacteria bacterium TaxID=2099670 RepID=A0A955L7F2_9BACT|nr:NAD(P)-binding domain-containing protein [Candidatus Dojkabacteria bacterium]
MHTIGIIGATGTMGAQIAQALSGNYPLILSTRDADKIDITKFPNSKVETDIQTTVENSDIIILALPYNNEQEIAEQIKEVSNNKIIVSISNPLSEDFSSLQTGWNTSTAEQLQEKLPHARVIKAFNTVFATKINNPQIGDDTLDHFYAGDNQESLQIIKELIEKIGHSPVYAGALEESRMLEHMAFLNIQLSIKEVFGWNSAFKIKS